MSICFQCMQPRAIQRKFWQTQPAQFWRSQPTTDVQTLRWASALTRMTTARNSCLVDCEPETLQYSPVPSHNIPTTKWSRWAFPIGTSVGILALPSNGILPCKIQFLSLKKQPTDQFFMLDELLCNLFPAHLRRLYVCRIPTQTCLQPTVLLGHRIEVSLFYVIVRHASDSINAWHKPHSARRRTSSLLAVTGDEPNYR